MQQTENNHQLIIDKQTEITVTDVESVLAFNDTKITLSLLGGTRLSVSGNDLKISGFSKSSGTFAATGKILGVAYGGKSFVQKLFK